MTPERQAGPDRFCVRTRLLDVEVQRWGAPDARPVLLLHGWPDSALTWSSLAPVLAADGWSVIVPSLRGYAGTRFLDPATPRSGQLSALAMDALDLADAMGLEHFAVVGHDWGARAAYILACLWPERVAACVAMSVGWGTNNAAQPLSMKQASNYWYHWFMHTQRGREAVHSRRRELTQFLWRQWSPGWRFTQAEFDATAVAFENPDWADVVVHSYTHRWAGAAGDPAYDALEERLSTPPMIRVPTLLIHGADDGVNDPASSEGKETLFEGRYRRLLLPGAGHFPQRERPEAVNREVSAFLRAEATASGMNSGDTRVR
jgi:pimeloyl-ACP methyl ester carboxylesterase